MHGAAAGPEPSGEQRRAWRSAAGAGAALLLAAWPLFGPTAVQLDRCRRRVPVLREQVERKRAVAARHAQARRELDRLGAALHAVESGLPAREQAVEAIDATTRAARSAGLEIRQARRRPEARMPRLGFSPFELRLRGTYAQVGQFFAHTAEIGPPVFIDELRLSVAAVRGDDVVLDVRCVAAVPWPRSEDADSTHADRDVREGNP